jgi:hypothetical protein
MLTLDDREKVRQSIKNYQNKAAKTTKNTCLGLTVFNGLILN